MRKINKIEEEFLNEELSWELKELGFDEPCYASIITHCFFGFKWKNFHLSENDPWKNSNTELSNGRGVQLPTYRQAFEWFSDVWGYNETVYKDKDAYWCHDGWLVTRRFVFYGHAQEDLIESFIKKVKISRNGHL